MTALITGLGEKDLVALTVDADGASGAATGTLVAAGGHLFWVGDTDRWVDAGEPRAGDEVTTPDGGRLPVVSGPRW